MAEWIRRLTTDQEIPGSSPGRVDKNFFFLEAQSFDLWTSRLQSERSADWAIPPFSSCTFNKNVFNPNPNPKGLGLISILTLTLTLRTIEQ